MCGNFGCRTFYFGEINNMKKFFAYLSTIFILMSFTSCGKIAKPTEKTIKSDLEGNDTIQTCFVSDFTSSENYEIEELEIEKRQTNIKSKEDIIHLNLTMKNEYLEIILSTKCVYNYYDKGGWILDDLEITGQEATPISAPNTEAIIKHYNDKISKNSESIKYLHSELNHLSKDPVTATNTNFKDKTASVKTISENKIQKISGIINLKFDNKNGWIITSLDDTKNECIEVVDIKTDYNCALGNYICTEGKFKGAKLNIISIDKNSIEYKMNAPKSLEEDYLTIGPIHKTSDFDPLANLATFTYGYIEYEEIYTDEDGEHYGEYIDIYCKYDPEKDTWTDTRQIYLNGVKEDFQVVFHR